MMDSNRRGCGNDKQFLTMVPLRLQRLLGILSRDMVDHLRRLAKVLIYGALLRRAYIHLPRLLYNQLQLPVDFGQLCVTTLLKSRVDRRGPR